MVVLECNDDGLYKLGNQFVTITELFSRNQFTVCETKFLDIDISTTGGQGYKRCHCKTKCGNRKCLCKAAGILCNSKCHSSLSCSNK
ncbi:hypothetical protein ABMA27_002198 [Loxostege sticticalis]|uniref:Metallothionein n=1 Tax=Loxostege sticticalis TaxID=481309 RepID=A0ABR3HWX2_LOXSC